MERMRKLGLRRLYASGARIARSVTLDQVPNAVVEKYGKGAVAQVLALSGGVHATYDENRRCHEWESWEHASHLQARQARYHPPSAEFR